MLRRSNGLKQVLVLTLITLLLISGYVFGAEPSKTFNNIDERIDYLKSMIKYIEANYANEITEEELMEGIYKGLFSTLDPHSNYFEPEAFESFNISTSGNFGGIGISVGVRDDRITVIAPLEGTPGDKAGVKAGDTIISVDDEDMSGYPLEKAVELMRGEPGTKVKLGIKRNNQDKVLYFDIIRDIIEINPVNYEILTEKLGYIKIVQFNDNTSENVDKALEEFKNKGVQGIILDLRNNPGGLVSEAVNVADSFVPKGPVVHIDRKNKERQTYNSTNEKIDIPVVVLVNGGSASASEIVAGAIQDTKSGTIVGTQTYGKGTVQTVTPITNGGGIKLTIAEYLTPNERSIDGVGIKPDIIVKNLENINKEEVETFVPMIEEVKPTLGSKGLNVFGAQQRLGFIGYEIVKPAGIMDEATFEAIKQFQKSNGLHSYGVLDYTTRDKLNEKTIEVYNSGIEDLQLKKAIELLK